MRIHLAVDLIALGPALELAESVCDEIDSMWLGPALLKNEGLKATEAFKTSFCHKPIVADMRSVDDDGMEAELAFGAHADAVTVLAISSNTDVRAAVQVAVRLKKQVFGILSVEAGAVKRAKELEDMGVHGLVVRLSGNGCGGLLPDEIRQIASGGVPVFLYGCASPDALPMIASCRVHDVVVGPAIYAAPDVVAAARDFHKAASNV